ncbi:MAG: 1-(5-phosphoribosyl)-5-[(5-phosphoribosylamino)methylideneamino] imidazole-4-carboxamide isomerase, partial [Methanomassiliicoccaceae archaeon]|nr:1-(5-phosphoribosyl)-5-[(5-phosphoribosylamino)methylideneamino] imidazole-4-carboxamide isomerase [Methanomassiliicoccaceae archaeon]
MLIIPAVDILDHKVVQLVGGVPGTEKITMPDPVEAAMMWTSKGARALHIIDLDGALGQK